MIMFTVLILALTWSLLLSSPFGGDGMLLFTHKRSLLPKGTTDVLQQPWISRNVRYQMTNFSPLNLCPTALVISMKDVVPIAYTGVPGKVDPLSCTSYALCSNGSHNEMLYLPEYASEIAENQCDSTSLWAANCTHHLCLTHCWLMRGDYHMGVDGKYRSDLYPCRIGCLPLTSRIILPPPNFKLSRA